MKLKWRYWLSLALVLGVTLTLVIRYGIGPRPIRVMKASEFENSQQIGAVVFRHLHMDLKDAPVVVFGAQEKWPAQVDIFAGYLKTAHAEGVSYAAVIVDESLAHYMTQVPTRVEVYRFQDQLQDLLQRVKDHLKANQKVALLTRSQFSSQYLTANFSDDLEKAIGTNVYSFSALNIALKKEDERKLLPACDSRIGTPGEVGYGRLGCVALTKSRSTYRKEFQTPNQIALMDRMGATDYLIFTSIH